MKSSKSIEKQIEEIYNKLYKKIYNQQRLHALSNGKRKALRKSVEVLESSDAYQKFAKEFAKKLAAKSITYQKGLWRKYFALAKRLNHIVLPDTYKEFELKMMEKLVLHNFDMIKSIPKKILEVSEKKYAEELIKQVMQGKLGRKTFENELKKHGAANAKMIARTETAKIQTALTENRSTELGSIAYEWIAAHDKRTRPSHKQMDGVIVFWRPYEQRPLLDNMRGNAGEFPNCRCDAQPIFDESDLTNSMYQVYDYRTDKIILMSQSNLLIALKGGGLN